MKIRIKFLLQLLAGSGFFLLLTHCAKVGTFSGGDKDSIPPVLVASRPEIGSLHFDSKKIELDFDEYLSLKSLPQEFLVSPPLKNKPVTKLKGKSLLIEIEDTLLPNTTYTLNFGNAVADFTEGNPIHNFEYVFSTGAFIDSFTFKGKIFNAIDSKPPKEQVLVMLFENLADSAPYKEIPLYAGRVDKEGIFALHNLRPDTFRVFALADANSNMRFDPPDEAIAFADTLLILHPDLFKMADTAIVVPDTLPAVASDSTLTDTLPPKKEYALSLELALFKEKNKKQYLSDSKRIDDKSLSFTFSLPLRDTFSVTPLDTFLLDPWAFVEASPRNDTLIYWIRDSLLYKKEILKMLVAHADLDSMGMPFTRTDTMDFRFTPKQAPKRKKDQPPPPLRSQLGISIPNPRLLDLYSPLIFLSPLPVDSIKPENIVLNELVDSIEKPVKFSFSRDSLHPRTLYIRAAWKEESKYQCIVFPQAVKNMYGIPVDTLKMEFSVQKLDYYGKLIVSVNKINTPVVLQLLDGEKLVRQIASPAKNKINFDFLNPKKYTLKAIEDLNGNGMWDTGDYLKGIQPERVLFYKELIEIRSNWDLDVEIDMSKVK
ncbi:MAG: Ig-like domain-containing protein [Bacteroidales bacterium]